MKRKRFVPLHDSVSSLFCEMGCELLVATKGRHFGQEKLAELIDEFACRYKAHVALRFNEMQERQWRAMQDDEYTPPEGAREIEL